MTDFTDTDLLRTLATDMQVSEKVYRPDWLQVTRNNKINSLE